jgi:pimeloyl-ACP methyl ester carboxylesterase
MKRLALLVTIGLCLLLVFGSPLASAQEEPLKVKELNFVFLHGGGGNACSMQLLADTIKEELPAYIADYELANPGTRIQFNTLLRCYPNDVDVETWANNVVDSINKYLPDKNNLILIGHSVGGKAALYAVAKNINYVANQTAMVVTINSPIKSLQGYYIAGGSALDFYRTLGILAESGVAESVVSYDSSQDGRWVAAHKHWLAFIAAESAPLSPQFNVGGVDTMPRDMDDTIIPISAQYSFGADVVYYGEHAHTDLASQGEVATLIADQILRYIFGGYMECSIFVRSGSLEHKAGWLPGTDIWDDVVGEIPASSGSVEHFNESFTSWQEWEDVVGECSPQHERGSYQFSQVGHFPFLSSVEEVRWFDAANTEDCRLYIKTRAAPRNKVQVDWSVYDAGLLPSGGKRNHYEIEITTGTPLTSIQRASWATDDPRDIRLRIDSEAESPFRWFHAEWRSYATEMRYRKIIDEMKTQPPSATTPPAQEQSRCCD